MIGSNLIQSVIRRFNNLLDTAAPANGAGMVGFLYGTAYAGNTVGAWLKGLATSAGPGFIGFLQAGAGGVLRTLADWMTDTVSSKNFGAKGDYNLTNSTGTDDTAAIQAAWTWCAANGRRLRQVGVSKITSPLVFPAGGQLDVIGAGARRTFDAGYAYRGVGTMLPGVGTDQNLTFANFSNLVFDGPGIGSGVDCINGNIYQGGADGCIFRNWRTAVQTFGSLATFKHNRFLACVNGILVTGWPAGTSQAGVGTTTFLSERNNFNGCTGRGLSLDTTATGGGNIVSSASVYDTFEGGCGTALYLNKSFDFLLHRPHTESSVTNSFVFINSNPTVIEPYFAGGDGARVSYTWPGASANGGGYNQLDLSGLTTRGVYFATKNGSAALTANDQGGIDLAGAGIVGTWTPTVTSSTGTNTGNAYSLQEGSYLRLGKWVQVAFRIVMTAKDAGMGGVIQISGLPFAADGTKANAYGNALRFSGVTLNGGAFTELVCDVSGTTGMPVKLGSGLAPTNLAPADVTAATTLSGTLIYLAA